MSMFNIKMFLHLSLLDHSVPGLQASHPGPKKIDNNSASHQSVTRVNIGKLVYHRVFLNLYRFGM